MSLGSERRQPLVGTLGPGAPMAIQPPASLASRGGADRRDLVESAQQLARNDVAKLCDLGVSFVELVTTEDLAACGVCRAVVGQLYATALVPLPPVEGCELGCCCQVAPLFLE